MSPEVDLSLLLFAALLPCLLLVAGGVLLIVASQRLSGWLLPAEPVESRPPGDRVPDLQAMLFSVAGVVLACLALPEVFHFLFQLLSLRAAEFSDARETLVRNSWSQAAAYGVQLALGVVLFLRGAGLAAYWGRLQRTRPMRR